MPDSAITKFNEPDDFQRSIRGTDLKAVVIGAPGYESELTRIDLHRVWIQHGRQSVPAVYHYAPMAGRASVLFLADDSRSEAFVSGIELSPSDLTRQAPSVEHHFRTTGDCHWQTMSLTTEALAEAARVLTGRDLPSSATTTVRSTAPHLMSRLRSLHNAAANLALTAPDILAHPEVAKVIEQELIRALVTCLAQDVPVTNIREGRVPVMQRFEEALAAREGQPVYLFDLCKEVGVSDRCLRRYCEEHLGMNPQRYLWLRRMNLVRRALLDADGRTTVTAAAADYGFFELGRFSVQYRALFGEKPSATLQRPSIKPRARSPILS